MTDRDLLGRESKYILDDDGEPVPVADVLVWGSWFQTADRVVIQTHVTRRGEALERPLLRGPSGGSAISTVFLGLDHQFGDGPPVLWETMIFGGALDGRQWRYSSRLDALRGHAAAVRCVQALGRRLPRKTKIAWHKRTTLDASTPRPREQRRLARLEARLERAVERAEV